MTRTEALDVAMFAVNALLSQTPTGDGDFAAFLTGAEDALQVLEQIHDDQMAQGESVA